MGAGMRVMYNAPVDGEVISATEQLAHLLGHTRDALTSVLGQGQRSPS